MRNIYDIRMTVPLGTRDGTLTFEEHDGQINGTIEILGHVTEFIGSMNGNIITMSGILKTSVRDINYRGSGTIENGIINVKLIDRESTYTLTGTFRKADFS